MRGDTAPLHHNKIPSIALLELRHLTPHAPSNFRREKNRLIRQHRTDTEEKTNHNPHRAGTPPSLHDGAIEPQRSHQNQCPDRYQNECIHENPQYKKPNK